MIRKSKVANLSPFSQRVIEVVASIPKGETLSYGEVAAQAGSPGAARAVGTLMSRYGITVTGIPCHRVIKGDGTLGGYTGDLNKKKELLREEGAQVKGL